MTAPRNDVSSVGRDAIFATWPRHLPGRLGVGLVALAACGCGRNDAAPGVAVVAMRPTSPPAIVPEAVTVEPRPWKTTVRSQGGLVADESTVVGARIAGRVAAVTVEMGQRVRAGDVLVRLDDIESRLLVEQAEARLGRARASLGLDPEEPEDAVDNETAPEVLAEKARLDEARTRLARLRPLFERNAVSRTELDEATAAVAVAEATLATAIQSVEEKKANVRLQRAEFALAREVFEQTVIRAPIDGLVQSRHASAVGASVREGQPLVTLVRTHPLRYRGTVPERQALLLREGQPVTVRLDGGVTPINTTVARIAPVLDEASRTLVFEADIPNPHGLLRSGLFAQADVVVDDKASALVIPLTSLLEFAGTQKVWLLDPAGGVPRSVPVRTGRRQKDLVEIVAGLSSGDRVVQHADIAAGVSVTN